jgi:AraC-like DNA-binding protein
MRNRSLLPLNMIRRIRREYLRLYKLDVDPIGFDGRILRIRPPAIRNLPVLMRARQDALQESVRWGEPCIFFLAPGILSWIVPVAHGHTVRGGLCGGEVRPHDDPADRTDAVNYLVESGASRVAAQSYVGRIPIWAQSRPPEAAEWLFARAHALAGWRPDLLEQNREHAAQQSQIAEEIRRRKLSDQRAYAPDQERALLALIRVGDRAGARRGLNALLARVFLYSPRLSVVQARMIELLGHLVRAAVEDNATLDSLLERHVRWIERVMEAKTFDASCAVLQQALDDFMHQIGLQGFNRHSGHVGKVLEFLAANFTRSVRLDEIAAAVGLSRFRVAHLVKECTGKTVLQHVKRLRIQRARVLLEDTGKDFAEIAYELGFADQSHFIRQFRELTGLTPARHRRSFATASRPASAQA